MIFNDIELLLRNDIIVTRHALQRIRERGIKMADIKEIILNGEIVEEYPAREPRPACLILYNNCHYIISIGESNLYLVTCYYPSENQWENDKKTRKRKDNPIGSDY